MRYNIPCNIVENLKTEATTNIYFENAIFRTFAIHHQTLNSLQVNYEVRKFSKFYFHKNLRFLENAYFVWFSYQHMWKAI